MSLANASISFDADNLSTTFDVVGFELDESLSEPFELKLSLTTDEAGFEPGTLLGEAVTTLIARGELSRDVHGIVVSVAEGPRPTSDELGIRLVVVPAWCALAQQQSARIFEDSTLPEIVEAVAGPTLTAFGRTIDTSNLTATYPVLEYTTQIDETDQAFLERIMAEHGVGYTFDHTGNAEALVLFDDLTSFGLLDSVGNTSGTLPVLGEEEPGVGGTEEALSFDLVSRMRPTSTAVQVFDWHNPGSVTRVADATASAHADLSRPVDGAARTPAREIIERDEPVATLGERHGALDVQRVTALGSMRRQLHRRDASVGRGRSSSIMMRPAVRFTLSGHAHADLDATYVCVGVKHRCGMVGDERSSFENRVKCLPAGVVWRPDRRRPKPRIHGIQTATVIGDQGDEIHTDAHGRIRVQFHWDVRAPDGQGSSCYLRVMQSLAGNGWGAMFLPRVGMEVVVSFIDGDPDRPVVTGCLYNGTHDPPYTLDDNKTRTVLKTQSTGQTGGYNELSFEDASGSEEVYVRAQKNLREEVLHDHTTTVTNDQSIMVCGNQTEEIDLDQTLTVHQHRNVTVDANFTEHVGGDETRTVDGSVDETISGTETRTVTQNASLDVGGSLTETVAGNFSNTTTGTHSTQATGAISTNTPSTHSLTANGGITLTTTAGCDIVAPTGLTVTGSGVTLVDNDYFSIASTSGTLNGQATSLVGYSLGGTILKTDFGVVSTAVNGVNLAANGVDLSASGIDNDNVGVKLKNAGTKIENAASFLKFCAILLIS